MAETQNLFTPVPRVQIPATAAAGELFQVKTLIAHQMETGLRHDRESNIIPRKIINQFTCRYNDAVVFNVDLHEAVSANPYLEFYLRATESGLIECTWHEDGGGVFALQHYLTVR
jgi:sulfur-oxidizing protein SoxZ